MASAGYRGRGANEYFVETSIKKKQGQKPQEGVMGDPPRAKPPIEAPTQKYLHELIVPLDCRKGGVPISRSRGGGAKINSGIDISVARGHRIHF